MPDGITPGWDLHRPPWIRVIDMTDSDTTVLEPDGEQTTDEEVGETSVDRYPALADAEVCGDSDLTTAERQTVISWTADVDHADVYSEDPSVVRSLLRHPEFDLTVLRISDEDRFGAQVSPDSYENDGAPITGVEGTVPIGLVKLQSRSRTENWASLVVSDHRPETDGQERSG